MKKLIVRKLIVRVILAILRSIGCTELVLARPGYHEGARYAPTMEHAGHRMIHSRKPMTIRAARFGRGAKVFTSAQDWE